VTPFCPLVACSELCNLCTVTDSSIFHAVSLICTHNARNLQVGTVVEASLVEFAPAEYHFRGYDLWLYWQSAWTRLGVAHLLVLLCDRLLVYKYQQLAVTIDGQGFNSVWRPYGALEERLTSPFLINSGVGEEDDV